MHHGNWCKLLPVLYPNNNGFVSDRHTYEVCTVKHLTVMTLKTGGLMGRSDVTSPGDIALHGTCNGARFFYVLLFFSHRMDGSISCATVFYVSRLRGPWNKLFLVSGLHHISPRDAGTAFNAHPEELRED